MGYHYSLLRFVPDPARGEFINLGILAGDDEAADWDLRLITNLRRARAIDDEGALSIAMSFLPTLQDHIAALDPATAELTKAEPLSTEYVLHLAEEMQNVVQLTAPAPIVASSAEEALDLLFGEFVVDPTSQRLRFSDKKPAQASTRRAYKAHEIPPEAVQEHAAIVAGPYEGVFDFAVANGTVVQLVQCWSFQLPNQAELAEQVKAWAWVVHELRSQGGSVTLTDRQADAERDVEVATVVVPPADGQEAPAYEEARAAFNEINVEQLTPDEADELGARAAERLQALAV
jgi:Protein of unknown function (DUF3037)